MQYALLIYAKPGAAEPPGADERETNHREYLDIRQLPGVVGGAPSTRERARIGSEYGTAGTAPSRMTKPDKRLWAAPLASAGIASGATRHHLRRRRNLLWPLRRCGSVCLHHAIVHGEDHAAYRGELLEACRVEGGGAALGRGERGAQLFHRVPFQLGD